MIVRRLFHRLPICSSDCSFPCSFVNFFGMLSRRMYRASAQVGVATQSETKIIREVLVISRNISCSVCWLGMRSFWRFHYVCINSRLEGLQFLEMSKDSKSNVWIYQLMSSRLWNPNRPRNSSVFSSTKKPWSCVVVYTHIAAPLALRLLTANDNFSPLALHVLVCLFNKFLAKLFVLLVSFRARVDLDIDKRTPSVDPGIGARKTPYGWIRIWRESLSSRLRMEC